ncbi:hypothetical protein [Paraburkholderia sp. GAS82]|uniref:hypothetical protein n=1 Tax=Paraburkholderia sp. GAS82 TaxID=3035137 RepID=UPI003D19309B
MSVAFRDPATGSTETRRLESETDILLMFSKPGSTRFALHIENTLATGTFTPDQSDFYLARARHMADNPTYGDYADFDTVLTAPRKFYDRWPDGCAKFERYISHEYISVHLPIFCVKNP